MYKKILVPLDGSALAESALPNAIDLAKKDDAQIVLLAVAERLYAPYMGLGAHMPVSGEAIVLASEAERANTERLKEYLAQKAQELEASNIRVSTETIFGVPGEEILDYATKNGVDLIVMSTHGHSGLARWVLGSVATKVVQSASMPVLVVRPK